MKLNSFRIFSKAGILRFKTTLRDYRVELLLFFLVFFSHSYFYNGAAWNHNSRLNTIFAFVEPGSPDFHSFRINRFIIDPEQGVNTGDWSRYRGDYYSNKAPGAALIGIPWYSFLYRLERAIGINPQLQAPALINAYLIHLFVTVLPVSISSVFFYRINLSLNPRQNQRALLFTVILYWGTLIFPYSSQLWGHATAAAFMIISLYWYIRNSFWGLFLSGFFVGMAVLTEYSCIISLAILFVVLSVSKDPGRIGALCLGGTIPFIAFAAYHKICFNSFITVANFYNNPYFLDANDVGKIFGALNFSALWGITFSPYRGLFFYLPVLLLIFPSLLFFFKNKHRKLYWICLVNIVAFLVMNISFNGWDGGACIGPRYQIPALVFYLIFLTALPDSKFYRNIQIALLIPSFLNMLLATIMSPVMYRNIANPVANYYAGFKLMLFNGADLIHPWDFPIRLQSAVTPAVKKLSSFNLGSLTGFAGLSSVLPWLFVFSLIVGYLLSMNSADEVTKN